MKNVLGILLLSFVLLGSNKDANAHCEIPCGIYGDSMRIELIREHISTIEKSIIQINELSEAKNIDYNQLVRWVNNKEEHANEIQEIVSQYFLHQRIKITDSSNVEAYAKYTNQLAILHQILVYSMKSKQSTNIENIKHLNNALDKFEHIYFHKHEHSH